MAYELEFDYSVKRSAPPARIRREWGVSSYEQMMPKAEMLIGEDVDEFGNQTREIKSLD